MQTSLSFLAGRQVTVQAIGPTDEFVVLATDGLWDVMPSQAAVNFLRLRLSNHRDLARATKVRLHKHSNLQSCPGGLGEFFWSQQSMACCPWHWWDPTT
jgi:hypothetical protein